MLDPIHLLVPFLTLLGPQHQAPDTFGHARHGEAFNEGPRQAAYRMEGMGEQVHMPVAGISPEAQAFFDQGLTQLHGFWYFESERSFRQVAKLQPDCALAYWGMTLANIENPERAVGFIANAVRRSEHAPRYDQLWIDAWASFYGIDDDARVELRSEDEERALQAIQALIDAHEELSEDELEGRNKQLLKDIGTVVHEFPDDIEAKALLAVQIWLVSDWGTGIEIVSHTAVDALLDQVLAKAPRHPAHHYRVHLWDYEEAERALVSAAALGDSAPGIAHQWHMAGHIYAKLHHHAEAAWQQQASSRVDHAHMRRDRVMPFEIHNYGHNQEWLARSLSYQGRVHEALGIAKNLAELPRHPELNRVGQRRDIAWLGRLRLAGLCEDHELWQTALQLQADGYLEPDEDVTAEVMRLGLVGRALFRLGQLDEAERVVKEVEALLPRARAERARAIDEAEDDALAVKRDEERLEEALDEALDEALRQGTDVVRAVLDLQRELEAERLLAQGDAAAAVEILADLERFPATLLADAHLAAGDALAAVELLEEEVEEDPHRFPTLARLVGAYRALAEAPNEPAAPPEAEVAEAAAETDGEPIADAAAERAEKHAQREAELRALSAAQGPLAARLSLPAPRPVTNADFFPEFGERPDPATLGPLTWTPVDAPGFDLPVAGGGRRSLVGQAGKPTLVVFYLGFGCLHCVEQLQALAPMADAFAAAGIEILTIGSDEAEHAAEALAAMTAEDRFPFPLLADPDLSAFRAWRCYDDFEEMPLHGTFLVDGDGRVRWQDISYEPFTELEFLLTESRRLLALPATAAVVAR